MKFFLSVSLLFGSFFLMSLSAHADFSDVPSDHPNSEAILFVQSEGIVQGYADGTFRPDQPINRAEFLKILILAFVGPEKVGSGESCFSDVESDVWFSPFVCYSKQAGIVGGYPDGSFRPVQYISFVEAAKIAVEARGVVVTPDEEWFKPYVEELAAASAIPTSILSFDHQLTRGEMAEIIYRLMRGMTSKTSKTYQELASFNSVIPEQRLEIYKDDATIFIDSSKRTPTEKFVPFPHSQSYVDQHAHQYIVELVQIPECSGSTISNSYIAPLKTNSKGYTYAIVYLDHDLSPEIQSKLNSLSSQDPECGYISRTPNNSSAIDELIQLYESTYKEGDLQRIGQIMKEIEGEIYKTSYLNGNRYSNPLLGISFSLLLDQPGPLHIYEEGHTIHVGPQDSIEVFQSSYGSGPLGPLSAVENFLSGLNVDNDVCEVSEEVVDNNVHVKITSTIPYENPEEECKDQGPSCWGNYQLEYEKQARESCSEYVTGSFGNFFLFQPEKTTMRFIFVNHLSGLDARPFDVESIQLFN